MSTKFRAPAVPLVTVDPYFNVWSMSSRLYDDFTRHWTGAKNSMMGIALIDNVPYVFAGRIEQSADEHCPRYPVMTQTALQTNPLSSIYTFSSGGVELEVDFTTPLLMDEPDIMSRPASYVTFKAFSKDNKQHDIKIYFDITAEWCVHSTSQKVKWGRKDLEDGICCRFIGSDEQDILGRSGDDVRIDWGYMNLAAGGGCKTKTLISNYSARRRFVEQGGLNGEDIINMPAVVKDEWPLLACEIDFGSIGSNPVSTFLVLAYDDIFSVEYFGKRLPAYWSLSCASFDDMLMRSIKEYAPIMKKCREFNNRLISEGMAAGGEKYADLLSVAYRQVVAAHKIVADDNEEILFFSKENFSNGCMATVDVSYPSIPLFLLYNTELVKGMMRPVFKFARKAEWKFEFAPHDAGCYPKANGQVYGLENGELLHKYQMPVEECGNMLIMAAAVCFMEGGTDFAEENWKLLTMWADYLKDNGLDPQNQLCTDDFAGHLAHNANLSIKAIVAIGAYSLLCSMQGKNEISEEYIRLARQMAKEWECKAREDDHYKLAFDNSDSWSMKYNLIWDVILDLNIFPKEVIERETKYYNKKLNQYGLPLDSRNTYTKSDWMVWVASLADSNELFDKLIGTLWIALDESPSRVPFTDWYDTITGRQIGFQNRSVVGGIFIKLLKDKVRKAFENK